VLTAVVLVSGKGQNLTHGIIEPITKKLSQIIMLATFTAVQILVQIRPRWGLLCKWVKYNKLFLFTYAFFKNTCAGQTSY